MLLKGNISLTYKKKFQALQKLLTGECEGWDPRLHSKTFGNLRNMQSIIGIWNAKIDHRKTVNPQYIDHTAGLTRGMFPLDAMDCFDSRSCVTELAQRLK
jgi:hypothetical protein